MALNRRQRRRLVQLYSSALIPKEQAALSGTVGGLVSLGDRLNQAARLRQALASGRTQANDLGSQSRALLQLSGVPRSPGPTGIASNASGGGFFSDVAGFFGNLGSDIWSTATHLPAGIFELGKATVHDLAGLATSDPTDDKSELKAKVLQPVVDQYKWQYGPLFQGHFGEFGKRLYQHPLGPILDAATVASAGLGATGRIGRLLAPEGRAARLISREGRTPVRPTERSREHAGSLGIELPEYPRLFSNRPLKRIAQLSTDRLIAGGLGAKRLPLTGGKTIQDFQGIRAVNRLADRLHTQEILEAQQRARAASHNFIEEAKNLTPEEGTALHLALRGINDRGLLAVAQDYWSKSLRGENPEGHNLDDFAGQDIPDGYVEHLANLPEKVAELVENPSPRMIAAANMWHVAVEEGRKELGIPNEVHAFNTVKTQRALRGITEDMTSEEIQRIIDGDLSDYLPARGEGKDIRHYPIKPSYVPDVSAAHMKFGKERGVLPFVKREGKGTRTKQPRLEPKDRDLRSVQYGAEDIFKPPYQAYLKQSDLGTFQSGTFRTDMRVLAQHLQQRENDLVHEIFNTKRIQHFAAKDLRTGEARRFKNQDEVNKVVGPGYTFVPFGGNGGFFRYFNAEHNVLREVIKRLEHADEHGIPFTDPNLVNQLNRLMEDNAKAFDRNLIGATKNEGFAVPNEFVNRMNAIAKSRETVMGGTPGLIYKKLLDKWRTLTLAYMPRWWINTAVGSAFLNLVKGVWNPKDYINALKYRSSGHMPAGVNLGGFAAYEHLEGAGGLRNALAPTKALYSGVEGIESYFRRASFMQSLRKEQRAAFTDIGDLLKSYVPFQKHEALNIDNMLQNPHLVERAIDDVNRFAYNMSELGPVERRYVRSFIPFWGWYKFITKLAWRLPLEHPGRALMITKLGLIGQETEKDLVGQLPLWAQGAIFLNSDKKHLLSLPTRGLNPFSSFANPFSPEGTIKGMLQLGQLSPLIQAALQGAGIDTLSADRTDISPESGVGFDFWGTPIDLATGQETTLAAHAGGRRALMSLLRSVPQFRMAEPFFTGGNPVYPESVPIISPRPMGVTPEARKQFDVFSMLQQYAGMDPRVRDIKGAQELMQKRAEYARTTNERQRRQLRKRLVQP